MRGTTSSLSSQRPRPVRPRALLASAVAVGCLLAFPVPEPVSEAHLSGPPSLATCPGVATSWSERRLLHLKVTVTGYSSTPDQTDDTPFTTASNKRVRPGIIALSRDLLRHYTRGAPFAFGDEVELDGLGTFIVEDTMAPRFQRRADIWFPTRAAATRWGRQSFRLYKLAPAEPMDDGGSLLEPLLAE